MNDYAEITKHLYKDKPCFDHLQQEASYSSGWGRFKLRGAKDIDVWIHPGNNMLKVKGSLPYYWQGHNFSFSREDLKASVKDISQRLGVNLWDAELSRFEYGCIVEVPQRPSTIISHHVRLKGMQTLIMNPDCKIFEGTMQSIKLYDAGKNMKAKLDKSIRSHLADVYGYEGGKYYLKVESHYKRPHLLLNGGIMVRVNDVLIPEFKEKCANDLLTKYSSIMKTGPIPIPKDKKALSAGNIILLAFKEAGKLFDINPEEMINTMLKEIPPEVLTPNDKKARKRTIREMQRKISNVRGIAPGKSAFDLYDSIREKLMLEN